ncbi:MAG: GW dipeptide domain-containing protein [Candidatus Marinimicrobia bacterium]|nr:GW dipeptide domain-containing protein [Candidatus Neomarinimicrobiota bacterium]
MRFKIVTIVSLSLLSLIACDTKERVKGDAQEQKMPGNHETMAAAHVVKVEEVIQANTYTYVRVTEGEKEYWIATAKQPIVEGADMSYVQGLEMKDFTSKELDRTFESIFFVDEMLGKSSRSMQGNVMGGNMQAAADNSISVEKAAGGVNIQELYTDMTKYDGKTITIRGQVTKYNPSIMGRNWVHIQDGTSAEKYFDLTLTTSDEVKKGDVVVFSGKVSLNKDFGAGYKYDLIVEDAILAKNS